MTTTNEKRTILIIDDEPELLEILSDEIEFMGYKVLTANSAIAALELLKDVSLQEAVIHAILSDINMPQMSGLDMLAKINEMAIEIPVVFISGYGDKEKATRAMRLGAMDMLDKPYDRKQLEQALERASNLGFALSTIEQEVDEIIKNTAKIPEEALALRNGVKELLRMKKIRAAYFETKS